MLLITVAVHVIEKVCVLRRTRQIFNPRLDHYATFMVHNGLIKEEIDILQGRVRKSIFMRHYFSPAIKELGDRVLNTVNEMMKVFPRERRKH